MKERKPGNRGTALANPWSGRFSEGMSQRLIRFNTSLPLEERLFAADVKGSAAHVKMLAQTGLLQEEEAQRLEQELNAILADWQQGEIQLKPELEDIHMNLEVLLTARLGSLGKKAHTARSRNDQQAAAQRIYFKDTTAKLIGLIHGLEKALFSHCQTHPGIIMPSYTHLQRAEFTYYAHWLATYIVMLDRDRTRFKQCLERADQCPLGGCASTGTSLPIDRQLTASLLNFQSPTLSSIDSVSDRDYLVEFTSHSALLMVHLSRLAEEIIIFTTQEFGFIRLTDAYCTGSSIMPQKKNPDVLELVRGKTGTVIGNAVSLLTIFKSLSLGYNKDMQEDKASWFSALDNCMDSVEMMTDIIATMEVVPGKMKAATGTGHILATEYANYLVRKGMPFREAHRVVGELVKTAEKQGCDISELSNKQLNESCPLFGPDIIDLSVEGLVEKKNSAGSCGAQALPEMFKQVKALIDVE